MQEQSISGSSTSQISVDLEQTLQPLIEAVINCAPTVRKTD